MIEIRYDLRYSILTAQLEVIFISYCF